MHNIKFSETAFKNMQALRNQGVDIGRLVCELEKQLDLAVTSGQYHTVSNGLFRLIIFNHFRVDIREVFNHSYQVLSVLDS